MLPKIHSGEAGHAGEIDLRYAFAKGIVEGVLGYNHESEDFDFEALKVHSDISIYDKDHNKVIVIETKGAKTPDDMLPAAHDQAFGYANQFTRFVLLTNFRRFMLYAADPEKDVLADVNLSQLASGDGPASSNASIALIDQFRFLAKEDIWDAKRFDDFVAPFAVRRPVSDPSVAPELAETLTRCMEYLYPYALRSFEEYIAAYKEYVEQRTELEKNLAQSQAAKDRALTMVLNNKLNSLSLHNKVYAELVEGFNLWETLTGRAPENAQDEQTEKKRKENRDVFCQESAYVQLNKILFVRICEDKDLLPLKLANGGIEAWRKFTLYLREEYKDLLKIAFSDATRLYEPLYLKGIFDWYLEGNSQLNEIFKRVLWYLNHYDFSEINDDILGALYEAYMPRETRKALGGFYTQKPIVEFILDRIGWTSDTDLRLKTLIDLGAGSGTFLVAAIRRFLSSLPKSLPADAALGLAVEAIHGLDIDPFATHLCEFNLVFQILDKYREVKLANPKKKIEPLDIHNTDSLEVPSAKQTSLLYHGESEALVRYLRQKTAADLAKERKYDFVVGNPPYVTYRIPPEKREYYRETYQESIFNRLNLYRLFVHRASQMMNHGARLGYIVPNTWIADKYARNFRQFLLKNFNILEVVPIPESVKAFFQVTQATTILVLERKDSGPNQDYELTVADPISDIQELHKVTWRTRFLSQIAYGEEFEWAFVLHSDDRVYELIKRMRPESSKGIVRLGDVKQVLEIKSGEVRQGEVSNRIFREPFEGAYVAVVGDNVEPFFVDTGRHRSDPFYYKRPDKGEQISRDDLSLRPRIIVQRIINQAAKRRLIAGYLDPRPGGVYAENGVCYIVLKEDSDLDPYYLLGLLNSSTLDLFARLFSSSNNLQPHELKRLPIPTSGAKKAMMVRIAELARSIEDRTRKLRGIESARGTLESALVGIEKVGVFQSPLIRSYPVAPKTFPVGLARQESTVFIGEANGFECLDQAVASYLVQALAFVTDLESFNHVQIPKARADVDLVLARLESSSRELKTLPDEIAAHIIELDSVVCELYELPTSIREMATSKSLSLPSTEEAGEDDEGSSLSVE